MCLHLQWPGALHSGRAEHPGVAPQNVKQFGPAKAKIVDNVYWQSTTLDDLGSLSNDSAFSLKQVSWANSTALNIMTKVPVNITGTLHALGDEDSFAINLRNPSQNSAFFERAVVTQGDDGDEVLPVI